MCALSKFCDLGQRLATCLVVMPLWLSGAAVQWWVIWQQVGFCFVEITQAVKMITVHWPKPTLHASSPVGFYLRCNLSEQNGVLRNAPRPLMGEYNGARFHFCAQPYTTGTSCLINAELSKAGLKCGCGKHQGYYCSFLG